MQFDLPKEQSSIIKVIGIGGGGNNAVTHMYKQGIRDVNFVICNTDEQHMEMSSVPTKIHLGPGLTEGRGAGSVPDIGRRATEESMADIEKILKTNTRMVFITAGMGGGTGTGGAPVVARMAKEMGILTVGIVTTPFEFEGKRRKQQAAEGIQQMKDSVDTLLVISNDKLREMYGNLTLSEAFAQADGVLTVAAKGIAEIITVPGSVNVDFEDVCTVMRESGVAIMGSASAQGDNRAARVVELALASPLLNDNDIRGARHILLNITSGPAREVTMDEISEITEYVQSAAGHEADVIWGNCLDERMEDRINLTVIATGFAGGYKASKPAAEERVVLDLDKSPEPAGFEPPPPPAPVFAPPPPPVPAREESPQRFFEFDLQPAEPPATPVSPADNAFTEEEEEMLPQEPRQTEDRVLKLRDLSIKLKNPTGVTELEKEPAFMRRGVKLEEPPHSSESSISRFSVEQGKDGRPEIRENNSFLHDNVD